MFIDKYIISLIDNHNVFFIIFINCKTINFSLIVLNLYKIKKKIAIKQVFENKIALYGTFAFIKLITNIKNLLNKKNIHVANKKIKINEICFFFFIKMYFNVRLRGI